MKINSNIPALNANRILGRNTSKLGETLERLSSGKRINRASDDAAGLAISQKMQSQIRGLQQASRNSLDGISMIQTGEGALGEVHEMLKRMRELSVQGANGVYGADDLEAILEEMTQLTDQIAKVAEQTDFNGVKILDGYKEEIDIDKLDADADNTFAKIKSLEEDIEAAQDRIREIDKDLAIGDLDDSKKTELETEKGNLETDIDNNILELSNKKNDYQTFIDDKETIDEEIQIREDMIKNFDKDLKKNQEEIDKKTSEIDKKYREIDKQRELVKAASDANKPALETKLNQLILEKNTLLGENTGLKETRKTLNDNRELRLEDLKNLSIDLDKLKKKSGIIIDEEEEKLSTMFIQVGANEGDDLLIDLKTVRVDINQLGRNLDAKGEIMEKDEEGKNGRSIKEEVVYLRDLVQVNAVKEEPRKVEDAFSTSIKTYDNAIQRISSIRARLGAVQNRLDSTIRTLDISVENLTSSMSRIEDIDMASEMTEFTKLQVLQQSSTAMLGEANKMPQMVLQLLQG